jgi:hypothetical protein
MSDTSPRRVFFKKVKPGDPISAGEQNRITDEISRLGGRSNRHEKSPTRAIKLFKLSEVVGEFGSDDSSEGHKRTGTVYYYDSDLDRFVPTPDTETKTNITDALDLIYDADEMVWCVYLEQSGQWHPLNPRTVRHARTVPDVDGTYPSCPANVFPIKFTKIVYPKTAGLQSTTISYLDASDDSPDDYVLNIFESEDGDLPAYVPLYTDICVYNVAGSWYAHTCCYPCDESSSSVSLSESSSSDSSSSLSSSSDSSQSSQSISRSSSSSDSSTSSSQSISDSSASSQSSVSDSSSGGSSASSRGSSASSDSESASSGGSSGGSSASSGYDCVTVVTRLEFNDETCELTYCVKEICFPKGLGITIGGESC